MTAPRAPLRIAHRGDWRRAPENSIAAFSAAMAIPACDGIEFDVRSSRDGIPVVCHDDTLERTHGRSSRVDALDAGDLEDLGVPSLEEVLASVGRRAFLDVELKADLGPDFVTVMAAGRGPALERSIVSSFLPDALERIAHLAPRWPRWFIAHRLERSAIATASELGCQAVAVGWRSIDAGAMRSARAAGLDVVAWTVRRRPTFDRLARLGVTGMCVEGPALDGDRTGTQP
jgi:glycerophosphoryl diester phosphodiesterase